MSRPYYNRKSLRTRYGGKLLTPEQLRRLRDAREDGVEWSALARRFGIAECTLREALAAEDRRQAFVKVETERWTTATRIEGEDAQEEMLKRLREAAVQ